MYMFEKEDRKRGEIVDTWAGVKASMVPDFRYLYLN